MMENEEKHKEKNKQSIMWPLISSTCFYIKPKMTKIKVDLKMVKCVK